MRCRTIKSILLFAFFLILIQVSGFDSPKQDVNLKNKIADTADITHCYNLGLEFKEKNLDSASFYFKKGLHIARSTHYKQQISSGLWLLANVEVKRGNRSFADSLFIEAINKFTFGDSLTYCKLKIDYAHLLYLQNKYEKALAIYREIVPFLTTGNHFESLILSYINQAKILNKKNDFPGAMEFFVKASELAAENNLPNKEALIYGNMGRLYFRQQQYDQSLLYFNKSLEIHSKLNNTENIAVCYQSIGTLYIINNDYKNAEIQLIKAGNCFQKLGITNKYLAVLNNLGVLYKRQKQYKKAQSNYINIIEIADAQGNLTFKSDALLNLSQVNAELGNYNTGLSQLQQALQIARKMGETDFREAYQDMAGMYELMGDYKNAFKWHNVFKEHSGSILDAEKYIESEKIKEQYEAEKKELLIEKITLENNEKHMIIQRSRIVIGGTSLLLIFLVVFIIAIKRQSNLKIASYKQLVKQSETILNSHKAARDKKLKENVVNDSLNRNDTTGTVPAEIRASILKRLDGLVNDKQFYKNTELTVSETARLLDTNTKYVSQVINDSFETNFSNFINQLRIEEAQRLLKDKSKNNFTLEEIGFQSGFKSKSVFNTAFKKTTGVTPSVYKKEVQLG